MSAHSEVFSSFVIQYDSIQHHSFIYTVKWFQVAQSAGAVEYTDCFSADPPPQRVSWYMTLNDLMVRFQQCWSFAEYPFIAIAPRSTLARSGSTWRVLSMGQIELNHAYFTILIFVFKLRIYAKLNCLK